MPRHSRRTLLNLLGTGTAALLAGCQSDSPTDTPTQGSTPSASSTATSTTAASETEIDTETESPTEMRDVADCVTTSRPEAAWPVPRRSPARDSFVADPNGVETEPAFAWEAEPSAPEDSHASPEYGLPVVVGDGLYVTKELHRGPERRMDGQVHALDTETGDQQWTSERLWSPSNPVASGDLAVVLAQDDDFNAMVVALDRKDGTRRWTREFTARNSGFVTAGDHLYLALEEDTDRGTIRALSDDGSRVWNHENAFDDHVYEGPAVGTDTVYAASRDGRLHALARDDGTTNWTHRYEHPTEQRPFVTDIVATTCSVITVVEGAVKALDDDGTLLWEVGGDHGTLATDGETIFVTADLEGGEQELRALDAATGEVRWTVGRPVTGLWPAVVATETIYVRFDESIAALDRADGTERWRTDGSLDDLALAEGTLYGTSGRTLLALR